VRCERRSDGAARGIATALLAAAALALGLPPASGREPAPIRIGDVLQDAPLEGLNGPSRQLAAYRGRPLIINVWASWCGPCVAEMSSLERLAWHDELPPFAVIGISTDDDAAQARAFLQRSHATLSQFIDRDQQWENRLGAGTIPLTVLVDADGRVVDKIHGMHDWDAPEALQLIGRAFRARRSGASR